MLMVMSLAAFLSSTHPSPSGGSVPLSIRSHRFRSAARLNLHELPSEPAFDTQIALRHAMVKRRGYTNNLAVLLVHRQVAAYAAIRTDGVSLRLAAFVP